MRLDKLLSNSGFGSRKEVKVLLKKKLVTVNGKIETKAEAKVDSEKDAILVYGEPVSYQKYIYLMMNKPQGVLSATEDNHQKTVIDLLAFELHQQELFPVGRLDKDTEGLLLLTDASVEDEGVAQGDDDEGLNVTDGEHVGVRLGWPVVIVSPA